MGSTYPVAVAAADLNGDGRTDLAVTQAVGHVSVLYNQGNGTFAREDHEIKAGILEDDLFSLAVGDLNGDGLPDLVTAGDGSEAVQILRNRTGARLLQQAQISGFVLEPPLPLATAANRIPNPEAVAVGDLNGDGRLDIAAVGAGGWVSLLLNHGGAGFSLDEVDLATADDTHPEPVSVAIADLNGDGRPEIAAADLTGVVSVLANQGGGHFALEPGLHLATPSDSNPEPDSVAARDMNGDGLPDLVVADLRGQAVSLLFNRGGGAFSAPVELSLPPASYPASIVVGDLNHDGRPDIAAACTGGATGTNSGVDVLLNEGGGKFAPSVTFHVGSPATPESLTLGDFNRDGRPDVAVADFNGYVRILLNTTGRPRPFSG